MMHLPGFEPILRRLPQMTDKTSGEAPWLDWPRVLLFLAILGIFVGVLWPWPDRPCKRFEERTIYTVPGRGTAGVETYKVCVER